MGKPGVMLYFELRHTLSLLTREEKGELFEAILDYGEFGVVPELSERLELVWGFIQNRLDRDSERYGRVIVRNDYARYARQMQILGEKRLPFDQWKLQMLPQKNADVSNENQWNSNESQWNSNESQWNSNENQWNSNETQWNSSENQWNSSCSQQQLQQQQQSQQQLQQQSQQQTQKQKQTQKQNLGPSATPAVFSPPTEADLLAYCREKGYQMDVRSFLDYYTANGWRIGKSPMKNWQAALRRWHRKENDHGETQIPDSWNVGTTL